MVLAGGGTGGHLFPGLAVAEQVATQPGGALLFIGSSTGIEARVVPSAGFPFVPLVIHGARGRGPAGFLAFAGRIPRALWRAWRELGRFRPDVVLGLGGYGSVPVVIAAWLRRIPSVLLEQNARPGWANRLLAHLAERVCTTFAESERFFPARRALHTGNPVRRLTPAPAAEASPSGFSLLVFGGSQGAHSINVAMVAAAPVLVAAVPGLRILHQTGRAEEETVRQAYAEAGVEAQVTDFIRDMGTAYGQADLVLCRAGATTIAELTAMGRPALLVPYPWAADDHQRANAEVLVAHGAAEMILDRDLDGERLAAAILRLHADPGKRTELGRQARSLAVPDAVERVLDVCEGLRKVRR